MHNYELAEQYCDMVYEDSRQQASAGMLQLPAALQSSLQGIASKGAGTPDKSGSDMYLLLIQVCTSMSTCIQHWMCWTVLYVTSSMTVSVSQCR